MLTVAFWLLPSKKKLYNIHTAQYICVKKRCKVMLILAAQAVRFQRQIMPYINFSVRQMMLLSKRRRPSANEKCFSRGDIGGSMAQFSKLFEKIPQCFVKPEYIIIPFLGLKLTVKDFSNICGV